jgi:hypothetical protein
MCRHTGKYFSRLLETFFPAHNGYWRPFGNSPMQTGDLVVNAYRVVEIFGEKPKQKQIPVWPIPYYVSRCFNWLYEKIQEKEFPASRRAPGSIAYKVSASTKHFGVKFC